jgi:hypothetical protein
MSDEEKLKRLMILEELEHCVFYAGVRADGNVAGSDLIDAIHFRKKEIMKPK